MKATSRNSFAKRSLSIAATALPLLCAGLANAQTAAPAPAPAVPGIPASIAPAAPPTGPVAAPIAGSNAPVAGTPVAAPAVVTPSATEAPAPPTVPAEPVDPMVEKYKHIDMGVWFRLGGALQDSGNPKKLGGFGGGGDVELHFSNQMRKTLLWTANFTAAFGAPDGGSFGNGGETGTVGVLDLIAQYEPDDAFHLWVGRMLVASDRSNFSGPWFMAPWIYPLLLGPQGAPYAVVGPQEGFNGRNDGATIWGQAAGGLFKYYLGAYRVFSDASPASAALGLARQKPLISGRLNLSLLNPEPGYYSSSTYYGMDILAIGLGGQYSKNQDVSFKPDASLGTPADYGMVNADILFEKNLAASGVFDAEGAFYSYIGKGEPLSYSTMIMASYLTPDVGIGKLQPLLRFQQAKQKSVADGGGGDNVTMVDGQVGLVIDQYATRLALGFTHGSNGADGAAKASSNSVFMGVQLQK